jgi:hypothetical protein
LSAVGPIGDKNGHGWFVRDVPIATDAPQQTASLFDHLVGASKQRRRHREAERLGGLEVDDTSAFIEFRARLRSGRSIAFNTDFLHGAPPHFELVLE